MKTSNIEQFTGTIDVLAQSVATGLPVKTVRSKLVMDALRKLTEYTPRDTGYLAMNWQVSMGAPVVGTIGVRGKKKNAHPRPIGKVPADAPAFSVVYITNNVEYAEYVENGTPRMRAHKMLERTTQDLGGITT